jgi:oligopeptide/dipeptide ABC transporter ATP-binding protein
MAALIEVRNLVKNFPIPGGKFVQACHKVSFQVGEREALGLVGESGSGKTTVGRCLLRLIEPTAGEIWFRGQRIDSLSPARFRPYRSRLQIVFQEPNESLNPRMTMGEVLDEPLRLHGLGTSRERSHRVTELLGMVGLSVGLAHSLPRELSAGTLQRISIARAIATKPEFIVLDEPTSSLAPDAEAEIIELLRQLQKELGLSYLFISHDLNLVRHFCDRVAVMYLSQVVETGTREDFFERPQHPYSRSLLASVLGIDPRHPRRDQPVSYRLEGEIPSPVDLPAACYLASRCPLVTERCRVETQELKAVGREHLVRCWRMAEGDVEDSLVARRSPAAT